MPFNTSCKKNMLKNKFKEEKPWALLGATRKDYDIAKPWKKTKLSKEEFGKLICSLPPEFF